MKHTKPAVIALYMACAAFTTQAQTPHRTDIAIAEGESWWGGAVALGARMPYTELGPFDLERRNDNNQVVPLLLSDRGRYVWSDEPFVFSVSGDTLRVVSAHTEISAAQAGATLREAYTAACRAHFPPTGELPDTLFFAMPQYNTWIELMYDQNQEDILRYARSVIDNGFPPGVLMIDDNWQKYYGNFEFRPEKFDDPEGMVRQLHRMGFKVMLWVCPFVSPDSPEYRDLAAKGYLLKSKGSRTPAIIRWWNGQSACYDTTNPEAVGHLVAELRSVQERYGIDGFKFDAGDNSFYDTSRIDGSDRSSLSVDYTEGWARIGLRFPFNEYRAGWKMGHAPLVQRLGDKNNSWGALRTLIPEMTAAGLLGYAYACPDMIGGGQFGSFLGKRPEDLDQELIVRSAQVHALMPMMQFSVAPWRVLDRRNMEIVRQAALLHQRFAPYILECARRTALTGEPIVRHMEYEFPGEGFADCRDQFMLGERYLVAPMVEKGTRRTVTLPVGRWRDEAGQTYRGGKSYTIEVPLWRLPYFERVK